MLLNYVSNSILTDISRQPGFPSVFFLHLVLRPTRHKTGHFGNVPKANLLAWYGKTKPNTTKAHIHQSKEMYYNTNIKN